MAVRDGDVLAERWGPVAPRPGGTEPRRASRRSLLDARRGERLLDARRGGRAPSRAPQVLDAKHPHFLGAEKCSNNTGELSGIAEALLWLRDEETRAGPAVLCYDSTRRAARDDRLRRVPRRWGSSSTRAEAEPFRDACNLTRSTRADAP